MRHMVPISASRSIPATHLSEASHSTAIAPVRDPFASHKGQGLYPALCRAIKENEFQLVYQPILNLRTGRFVGAESLLRWMHDGDLIAASDFIEALEKTDLLDTVADWAIREACSK